MNKAELRNMIARSLSDLTPEYKEEADRKIRDRIKSLDIYNDAQTVFCFVGTEDEIDTRPLIEEMLAEKKTVCVPLCTDKGVMVAKKISSLNELTEGTFGIYEPSGESETVSADDIDLAIVPCVTCNRRGQRLGHGGGFYDRYFEDIENKNTRTVLVCREETMVRAIPVDVHDKVFPTVITERNIYTN